MAKYLVGTRNSIYPNTPYSLEFNLHKSCVPNMITYVGTSRTWCDNRYLLVSKDVHYIYGVCPVIDIEIKT